MLNRVILMGRITHDLELKQTSNGITVLSFNLAVDRGYVKQGQERQTDFITCVAWNQRAEIINKYFFKGRMIALEGSIRTGSYVDKNKVTRYTTEVWVDNVSFTGEPKPQNNSQYPQNNAQQAAVPENNMQNNAPSNDALSIGDLADFEEVINDGGVPF